MDINHVQEKFFKSLEGKPNKNSMVELVLPFPPSVNHYWRQMVWKTKGGKHRVIFQISDRGLMYSVDVQNYITKHELTKRFSCGECLSVSMELHPPDRRVRDIDNYNKGLFDSLTKAKFWGDDKQVIRLYIEKREPIKHGKCIMRVISINPFEPTQSGMKL